MWRKAWRWTRRVVLGVLALAAVTIGVALIALHTDWGREQLRTRVVAALRESFPGGASIRRIEGSVLGELVLRDVELRDAAGRPAITATRMRVNLGYASLLRGEIELESLDVDGATVFVQLRSGAPPNLATAYRSTSDEPMAWDVALRRIRVRDLDVTIDRDGAIEHLDDLAIDAVVRLAAAGPIDAQVAVTGVARERAGAALAIAAQVRVDAAGVVTVPSAHVALDEIAIDARDVAYLGGVDVRGGVAIHAPADELARLAPELAIPRLGADVQVTVEPAPGGTLAIGLGGTVGGATVKGRLTARPPGAAPPGVLFGIPARALTGVAVAARPRVDGAIEVAGVDLARFGPGLPPSALDARLAVAVAIDPTAAGLGVIEGEVSITGRGVLAEVKLDELHAGVTVAGGVARLAAHGRGPGGAEVAATGRVTMTGEVIALDDGHVEANVASIRLATQGAVAAGGAVEVDLHGAARFGADTHVAVRGAVRGRAITMDDLRVGDVRVELIAAGAPRAMTGEVTLAARQLTKGDLVLPAVGVTARGSIAGPIDVRLDATDGVRAVRGEVAARVTLPPPETPHVLATIALGDYRFDVPRAQITGTGGRITIEDERLVVREIRMSGAGGTLAIDAVAGRGRRAGQLDGQVALVGLDLARLRGLPGVPRKLAGALAIRADLRRRGRAVEGEVQASATKLVLHAGARPVEVAVSAEVRPRRVELAINASGPELGALTATIDVTPPRRLDDVAAWTRLERTAIAAVALDAQQLDLARLAQLAGQAPTVEGTVDARIALDETHAAVEVRGHRLLVAGAPAPIDLELELDLADPTTARVAARATLREIGRATLAGAVGLPARPFDLAAWRATDRRSVQAVALTIDEIELDETLARRLGLEGVRGKIAASVTAEPGLRALALHVTGRDVIAGPLVTPAAIALDATVDDQGARATVGVGLAGATVVSGEVTAPITIARALAGDVDPAAVALAGALQIADTPVATLTRALAQDTPQPMGGRVRGTATLRGTLAAPGGAIALVVNDLGARTPRQGGPPRGGIRELTVDASYQDGAVHAAVRGDEADGGKLAIVADVDPARLASARASITATGFQLAPLTRLAPALLLGVRGVLDADLQLRGADPATARLSGLARLTGVQAPITDTIGNLRDGTIAISFQGATARVAVNGAVESGRVEVIATATLIGLVPDAAQLDVTVRDVKLITAAAPRFAGKLHVDVTRDDGLWRAVARVHDAEVVVPEEEGRELHPASLPADLVFTSDLRPGVDVPRTRASALRAWLGVRPSRPLLVVVVTIEPVTVVSDELRGEVQGRLELAIGEDGASVDGRIGVLRGNVVLFERRYGVRRADLVFDGSIDPLLDIQLEYDFPQLSMRVSLGGRLSKPTLTLASNPSTYTEGQLLAILLGGTPGTGGNETTAFVTGVAATAASQLVGGFVTRKLPIRIDVLNYEPATTSSSGAFVVGRWITSKLLLLLRTRVEARADENVTEAEVELWLNPRVLLETTAGDRGVIGADLLWNRRW